MDCFYHNSVPSVAACRGCKKPVCASCRTENGDCPGCVLAARIDAARGANVIHGEVGPSSGTYAGYQQQPPPQYAPPPPQYAAPPRVQPSATVAVRDETRALVALGYPFWPLALIAMLDGKASHFVKRQAWQALGWNLGMWGLFSALTAAVAIPVLNVSVWVMLPFVLPVWVVGSVIYGIKVWQGEDVNVPIVCDWVDARLPGARPQPGATR